MSAITDDEIALLEADMLEVEALRSVTTESLIARIRADAATIAELRRQVDEYDGTLSEMQTAIYDVHEVFNTLLDVDGNHTTFGSPARRLQALLYQHKDALDAKDETIARLRAVAEAVDDARCEDFDLPDCIDRAFEALAPGDLGGEG